VDSHNTPAAETIIVQIDDIDMANRLVHAFDKTNVRITASYRNQPGGLMLIPSRGERWTAHRSGWIWYLDKRIDSADEAAHAVANLSPGDARLSASGIIDTTMRGFYMNNRGIGPTVKDNFYQDTGFTSVVLSSAPVSFESLHPTLNGMAISNDLYTYDFDTRTVTFNSTMGAGALLVTYQTWVYANDDAARLGPSARIEVRVLRFVFGVETPLALSLDSKLKRNPPDADVELFFEVEGWIEGEIRERTFVVRVHLDLAQCHLSYLVTSPMI